MKSLDRNKIDDSLFERKIDLATTKLQRQFYRRMINLPSKSNALAIADFILAMKTEANLSDNHRANYVMVLSSLSSSDGSNNRIFLEMNRQDILTFLNNCRKPDMKIGYTSGLALITCIDLCYYIFSDGCIILMLSRGKGQNLL
jgi:hypothetical protein